MLLGKFASVIALLLLSGCAERFHGIPVSPTDCRDFHGVHVACREKGDFFGPSQSQIRNNDLTLLTLTKTLC